MAPASFRLMPGTHRPGPGGSSALRLLCLSLVLLATLPACQPPPAEAPAPPLPEPPIDSPALALRLRADSCYTLALNESTLPAQQQALRETLRYARAAAERAENASDWHTWGEAQNYALAACYQLQDFASAAATFPLLEPKARAHIPPDNPFWGEYLTTAGAIANGLGDFEAALQYGLQGVSFFEKTGQAEYLALANNNAGAFFMGRGDYDRALDYTRAALQGYSTLPEPATEDLIWTYNNLSQIWYCKKNYPEAIACSEKGLALLRAQPGARSSFEAELYLNLAGAHADLRHYEKALACLQQALRIQEKQDLGQTLRYTYDNLAFVYTQLRRFAEARHYQQLALSAFEPDHPFYGKVCRHMGLLCQAQGQWQPALEWQQKALLALSGQTQPSPDSLANPDLSGANAWYDVLYALSEKGQTLRRLAQLESEPALLDAALATFDLATSVLDTMRQGYQEGSALFWSREARPILEQAIDLALLRHQQTQQDNYLAQAFGYAEKGKAYLLAEALRESVARQKAGIPEAELVQEKQLKINIAFYQKLIFEEQRHAPVDTAKILRWQAEILGQRRAYEALAARLKTSYPEYYRIKFQQATPGLAEIRQALPANTGLIEYFQGDSATYAFYIDRQGARALRCQPDSSLLRLLDGMRDADQASEQGRSPAAVGAFARDAAGLYRRLLAPVLPPQTPEQLILIPDGQLACLPFDVLLTRAPEASAPLTYASLPYLLRETTLRYEYSAALVVQPGLEHHSTRFWDGYAPEYRPDRIAEARRGSLDNCDPWPGQTLASLPNNRREVSQIAARTGGRAIAGPEATEARFREEAAAPRILHLALHGLLNDCDPAYSGLVFSAASAQTPKDAAADGQDGILYAYEIYNLHLNAELAVLSACNTGQGQLARGEGVMSLARAFKYAGCPNVLMSLWQADDAATAGLMEAFYSQLAAGKGKAAALQQAKLEYLAHNHRQHPFYWSAFVLIGDDQPLQPTRPWVGYAGGLLLLAGLTWLLLRRRQSGR